MSANTVDRAQFDALVAAGMTEKAFRAHVISAAQQRGWLVWYLPDSRKTRAGWPDLAMVNPMLRRFMVRELKREKGRLSVEQTRALGSVPRHSAFML